MEEMTSVEFAARQGQLLGSLQTAIDELLEAHAAGDKDREERAMKKLETLRKK